MGREEGRSWRRTGCAAADAGERRVSSANSSEAREGDGVSFGDVRGRASWRLVSEELLLEVDVETGDGRMSFGRVRGV